VLSEKQRQKIISKLSSQMSDNEIAEKCGVSRTTVWRIRQDETAKQAKRKRIEARMKAKEKQAAETAPKTSPAAIPPVLVEVVSPAVAAKVEVQPENNVEHLPVMPKVDVEPVNLANYFAVQILRGESVKDVAYAVIKAAEAEGFLFRKLQVLDCISVGTASFARFRSDLGDLASILNASNRGYIAFDDGCYRVSLPGHRPGLKYPTTVLCSVGKSGFGQIYAGPKVARWAQQFPRAN
jgi:hypothetical protein